MCWVWVRKTNKKMNEKRLGSDKYFRDFFQKVDFYQLKFVWVQKIFKTNPTPKSFESTKLICFGFPNQNKIKPGHRFRNCFIFRRTPTLYVALFSPQKKLQLPVCLSVHDTVQVHTSLYDVARLHLITPMHFWRNSTT